MTTLDYRELTAINYVLRFNQLPASHFLELVFDGNPSLKTSRDRLLKRLTDRGILARIERRSPGGAHGGSGQFFYQLGAEGRRMYKPPTKQFVVENFHTRSIADAFVMLVKQARTGAFTIEDWSTEPDCHVTVHGRYHLKPDLYIELGKAGLPNRKIWLEIDMASQGDKDIKAKFHRYYGAFSNLHEDDHNMPNYDPVYWTQFPEIVFAAIHDERRAKLKRLLSSIPEPQRKLFTITTLEELSTVFS